MTKQRDLLKKIRKAAKAQGIDFELARHGGNHDVYTLDGLTIAVPRHAEIGPKMTSVIYKECEPKLGKGWWK